MVSQTKLNPSDIIALDVFLERTKTRSYVGRLSYEKKERHSPFIFEYDARYVYGKNSIPLGPDIPLTKKKHVSETLFKSLTDRIPSVSNPSYKQYCKVFGVSPDEKNQIILLATIGKRGPSSFVFEPVYRDIVTREQLKGFRASLGITIREFAYVFDFSPVTVIKLESGAKVGKDALKRICIYYRFPEVGLNELQVRGSILIDPKRQKAQEFFHSKIQE